MIGHPTPEVVGPGYEIADYTGRTLIVTGDWSAKTEKALKRYSVDSLALNYARGYRERDLSFLHEGMNIRNLDVLARTIKDVSPILRLGKTLQRVSVEVAPTAQLDLTQLPHITEVSAEWSNICATLSSVDNLRRLFTLSYNERDLLPLGIHPNLRSLRFKQYPQMETLNGIQYYPALEELGVFLAPRLRDISDLTLLPVGNLRYLEIESCKGVSQFDPAGRFTQLEMLNISDNGLIESLAPLRTLSKLEILYAYESTNVMDEDLSPLLALPALREVRMQSRRAYKPSLAEVNQQLVGAK